jgi:hypothetical protein
LVTVIVGIVVSVPTLYIPGVYDGVFKQAPIDQEWAVVGVCLVVFVAATEAFKAIKRCTMSKHKILDQVEIDE